MAVIAPEFCTTSSPSRVSIPTASAVAVEVVSAALRPFPAIATPTEGVVASESTTIVPWFQILLSTDPAAMPRAVALAVVPPSQTSSSAAATPLPAMSTLTVTAVAVAAAVMSPLFQRLSVAAPGSMPTDSAVAVAVLTEADRPLPTIETPTEAVTAVESAVMLPELTTVLLPAPASMPLATAAASTPPSHTSLPEMATPFPEMSMLIASALA